MPTWLCHQHFAMYPLNRHNNRFWWEISDHLPYSPDFAPIDLNLLGPSKKYLGDQHLRTYAEVQQAVLTWLYNLDTDLHDAGFNGLVHQWNK
ncbi:hypothetical protein TNCV_621481 [Trichonephila clavipes]|nr:hypothetical protein TNCV_621481 [Trichonephila clavipes]